MTTKPETISAFDQCNAQVNTVKKNWGKPEIILISNDHVSAKSRPFAHEHTMVPVPGHPSRLERLGSSTVFELAANKLLYLS